jgi:hypothetical protein
MARRKRYQVRLTRTAQDQLAQLWVDAQSGPLRAAMTRASNELDRILGAAPNTVGVPAPTDALPTRRLVAEYPFLVYFVVMPSVSEVYVTELELDVPPLVGP